MSFRIDMRRGVSFVAVLALIAAPGHMYAQDPRLLNIQVDRGDGALNDLKTRRAETIGLVVKDQFDRPVEGARVTVTAPLGGPSVSFAGGERTWTGTTGPQGQLEVAGMEPNEMEGRFVMRIVATEGERSGSATISQINSMAVASSPRSTRRKWLVILGVAGGAAAAGLAARAASGSSSSGGGAAPGPTSVSLGSISVGGPR